MAGSSAKTSPGRFRDLRRGERAGADFETRSFASFESDSYAVALVLALVGAGDGLNATLAWTYVGFRVAHSLWHALINKVGPRFLLFTLSSLVLLALVVRAALAIF